VDTQVAVFSKYLAANKAELKQRCLEMLGPGVSFNSRNLSVERLLDIVIEATSGRLTENESVSRFLELGVELSREGWPLRLALETINTYRQVVWTELRPYVDMPGEHFGVTSTWPIRPYFDPEEFQQLSRRIDGWTERMVDSYVAHKENYVMHLYQKLNAGKSEQETQLQTAREMAGTICHLLSQPLTVLYYLSHQIKQAELLPDEIELFQQAVDQANDVLKKLRNLKRYETNQFTGVIPNFDLEASAL
jgi:hypothetical protein